MRRFVLAAIIGLGVVVGCSQEDGATPTALIPDPPVTSTLDSTGDPNVGRGFVPLDNPALLSADEATYLDDDELILGVEWAGGVRAYPLRMLRFHHVVNDTVGGKPLLITY